MQEPNKIKPEEKRYQFKPFIGSSHSWAISLLQELPKESKILDFGCGSGAIGGKLREVGFTNIYATDLSDTVRIHVKDIYNKVAKNLSELNEKEFDTVIILDVIEHMTNPKEFLIELLKIVKPGGKVLISVPNVVHWSVRIPFLFGFFEYTSRGILDRTHYTFFTRKTKNKLFKELEDVILVRTDVSISPAEFVLPESLRDTLFMKIFNNTRLALARTFPGIGGYQLLSLIQKR